MKPHLIKWLSGLGSLLTFSFYLAYTYPLPKINAETTTSDDESFQLSNPLLDNSAQKSLRVGPGANEIIQVQRQPDFEIVQSTNVPKTESFEAQSKNTTKPRPKKSVRQKKTTTNRVNPTSTIQPEAPIDTIDAQQIIEPTPLVEDLNSLEWTIETPAPRKRFRSRAS